MNSVVYILFVINLILIHRELSVMLQMRRIKAVKLLTEIYSVQVFVASVNVILCIICIIRLIKAFPITTIDFRFYGRLVGDLFIGFISILIMLRHSTPKKASINHYMEVWYHNILEEVKHQKKDGLLPDTYQFKKPTIEEFLDPNWSPIPKETNASVQDESDNQPLDADDIILQDECDDQEHEDDYYELSLDERLIEMLEDNERIDALRLYMEETGDLLSESLDYIESLSPFDEELTDPESGPDEYDNQVKYCVLLKTVNDGPVSAARYYSEAYDVDFMESQKRVKEINEEFDNYID